MSAKHRRRDACERVAGAVEDDAVRFCIVFLSYMTSPKRTQGLG